MIKILKKQSSRNPLLSLTLLFSFQGIFFYYAVSYNRLFLAIQISIYIWVSAIIYFLHKESRKKQGILSLAIEESQENANLLLDNNKKIKLSNDALNDQIIRYNSLEHLIGKLNSTLLQEDISNLLISYAFKLIAKEKGVCILYILNPQNERLYAIAAKKEDPSAVIKTKEGDIFDGWVLKKNQPLIIEDAKVDFRFDLEKIQTGEPRIFRSIVGCPLLSGKNLLGVLRLDNPKAGYFNSDDLRLLQTIADLGAVAIENAQLYKRTEELAIRDGLTNLYLRGYLLERFDIELIRAGKEKGALSILMVDIDYFKKYNDKFGHVAGDIVLKNISKILRDIFDVPGNLIGRYGGEEFMLLLPNASKSQARALADKLRHRIEEETIVLRKKSTQVTVSIGLSNFPEDATGKVELIELADKALYKAKGKGRNMVCSA